MPTWITGSSPGDDEMGIASSLERHAMKLDKAKLERVLKTPDSIGALLFYGPDEGLAHELAGQAQRAVLGAEDDPFRLVELTPDQIEKDPARLTDELNAISMLGGRRVVRVAQATNAIADQIADAIEARADGAALLIVEAGDIGSRKPLVQVFEADKKRAGAFGCYRDNEAQLGPLIAAHLKAGGYSIARDAQAYLAERLGGDRGVTRSELDKLMLYVGEPKQDVTLADAIACIGDRAAFALDDLIGAAAEGDVVALDRHCARSFAEVEAIQLLRGAARHFQRLHQVVARMADGDSFEAAAGALRPPLF
ncbi:MAG: DNA polymerase III subunit delta, partial [Dongiaceae bacterium]